MTEEDFRTDFEKRFEVVDHNEVGIGDEEPRERQETETHYADGTQKFDTFGAPVQKPVRVVDGVRDSRRT